VTKLQLMNNFKRVSWYTTETTNNANRNTNIDLASKAINGHVVKPGEVFSFNETTGKRTEEKGYKEAIAISGGQAVPDIGGGVCQTSGTLFNAVARADLEIVYRSPHAWPSSYVQKGMDATVNWPDLDFKFRNNKNTPIFIISYYNDRKITVEIYGMSLGDGVSIDLKSEVVKTIRPPSDVKYVQNPNLAPGTSKETIDSRTGYVVDTYKVWYKDGQEFKREKLCTSNYKAYQKTVEYN
jgi:vancomycin resistance protein YoaR